MTVGQLFMLSKLKDSAVYASMCYVVFTIVHELNSALSFVWFSLSKEFCSSRHATLSHSNLVRDLWY